MPKLTQAHILHCEGADAVADRIVRENAKVRMIVVFIPDPSVAAAVAADLCRDEGVSLIELDGGLSAGCAAAVIDAVGDGVAIGRVMFGAESLAAAASFGKKYGRASQTTGH